MYVYRNKVYNYIKLLFKIVLFTVSVKLLRLFSGEFAKLTQQIRHMVQKCERYKDFPSGSVGKEQPEKQVGVDYGSLRNTQHRETVRICHVSTGPEGTQILGQPLFGCYCEGVFG